MRPNNFSLRGSVFVLAWTILGCLSASSQTSGPGTGVSLNGTTNAWLNVPNGTWFSGNFTVEGWVFARSYSSWSRLIDFSDGPNNYNVYLALTDGTLGFPTMGVFTNNEGTPTFSATTQLPTNQWVHLAATGNGTTGTIYLNGLPVGTGTLNIAPNIIRTNNYIGRSAYAADGYANATFDELSIWNVARTRAQIQTGMNHPLVGNESGLVGYWRFDEGSGTNTFDSTGNGNTATLNSGVTWAASTAPLTNAADYALSFTGSQTVTLPHLTAQDAYPFTVMCWFMEPTNSPGGGALVGNYHSSSFNGWSIGIGSQLYAWYWRDQTDNASKCVAGPVNDGLWHHAAFVVDSGGGHLYLDGVLKQTVAWAGTAGACTTTSAVFLGIYQGDSLLTGALDEVSIWNVALTQSQIQAYMHQSLQGTETGLVNYYRMNEGIGTNIYDYTANVDTGIFSSLTPNWILSGAQMQESPQVVTLPATVNGASATLNGTVNPQGLNSGSWFRWGSTTSYGNVTETNPFAAGYTVSTNTLTVNNLTTGTYHFQIVATNSSGINYGLDQSFTITAVPPSVTNQPASNITPTSATLNASVNPGGAATTVYFVYGTDTTYGTTNVVGNIGSGTTAVPVSTALTNLAPGTLYHFTTIASNAAGMVADVDATFSTLSLFSPVSDGLISGLAQSVIWGDFNNDGRLDLLEMPFVMSNQVNGTFSGVFDGLAAAYYGSQVWADFDNDGYLDVLVTGTHDNANPIQTVLLHNNHNGAFTVNANTGLPNCFFSSIAVGDFDNDGRPDVLIMGYVGQGPNGNIDVSGLYHNNGDGTFTQVPIPGLPVGNSGTVACGDFDNDGHLDFIIAGSHLGLTSATANYFCQIWRNNGDGTFTQMPVSGLPQMYVASVAVADYNDDSHLDFAITGATYQYGVQITQIWKNNGNWNFTLETNAVLPTLYDGAVAWGDFDNDGYPDLALAGATSGSSSSPIAQLWRNTGNGTFANINANLPAYIYNSMAFGDFNNDGRLDFVQLGYAGGGHVDLEKNNTPVTNTPPIAPMGLQTVVNGSGVRLTWQAASDAQTLATGLSYNIRVSTSPNGINIVSPMADPATGLRRLPQLGNAGEALQAVLTNLPAGTYYWSVQAIDTAFAGSLFATQSQFTITVPIVATGPTGLITSGSDALTGSVIPNGSDAFAWFQWGTSIWNLTNNTAPAFISGTNTGFVPVSLTAIGLSPLTQYYYRLAASNTAGLAVGAISNFTTVPAIVQLGTTNLLEGPAHGTDSVIVVVGPTTTAWSASANNSWLHLIATNFNGGTNLLFTFDTNADVTRTGSISIGNQTLIVTQAGAGYVAAHDTTLNSNGVLSPFGVALDGVGNVYWAGTGVIQEWIKTNNTIITLVSNGLVNPISVAVDSTGNVYIADSYTSTIYEWTVADGHLNPLVSSGLNTPYAIALDSAGNVYIADQLNNAIKEWLAASSNVVTLVSTGLNNPSGVAVDLAGNVYIADTFNNMLKEWSPTSGNATVLASQSNGIGLPFNLAVDGSGNVFMGQPASGDVLEWSPGGTVKVAAYTSSFGAAVDSAGNVFMAPNNGSLEPSTVDELPRAFVIPTAASEPFTGGNDSLPPVVPAGILQSPGLYPAPDQPWVAITGVTNDVTSFSFAPNTTGAPRTANIVLLGYNMPITQNAIVLSTTNLLEGPLAGTDSVSLAISPPLVPWTASANVGWLHPPVGYPTVAVPTNVVFAFDANPGATRTGTLTLGTTALNVTQAGVTYVAAPVPLTALVTNGLLAPANVAVDISGNVYIANTAGQAMDEWLLASNSLEPLVYSGLAQPTGVAFDNANGYMFYSDTASNVVYIWVQGLGNTLYPLVTAGLNSPRGIALDSSDDVYIADTGNNAVEEFSPSTGNLVPLVSGLNQPQGVAVDVFGDLYIADTGNNAIKEWFPANSNVVTIVASGLNHPTGVAVDASGNIFIADTGDNAVKKWTAATGTLTTLVGAGLNHPTGVTLDGADDLYIADTGNNAIKELPRAFVDPTARTEAYPAGSDALPVILPASVNLLPPFVPVSDQSWLTVTSTAGSIVNFAFTINIGTLSPRTAHLNVLGESVSVTQTNAPVTPPHLTGAQRLGNGAFQFMFTNTPGTTFTVLGTTNLALTNWVNLGTVSNISPGVFQFTTQPLTNSREFYRVSWP